MRGLQNTPEDLIKVPQYGQLSRGGYALLRRFEVRFIRSIFATCYGKVVSTRNQGKKQPPLEIGLQIRAYSGPSLQCETTATGSVELGQVRRLELAGEGGRDTNLTEAG